MISRMITTVIATGPMFFTISVIVNSVPPACAADGLGVCKRNRRKPIAFVPRMVVKIVTVTPPKVFDYISDWQLKPESRQPMDFDCRRLVHLLRYKVVDDYAVDLHRLSRKIRRR